MVELRCDYADLVSEAEVSISSLRHQIEYLDSSVYVRKQGNVVQFASGSTSPY